MDPVWLDPSNSGLSCTCTIVTEGHTDANELDTLLSRHGLASPFVGVRRRWRNVDCVFAAIDHSNAYSKSNAYTYAECRAGGARSRADNVTSSPSCWDR
jgi:hypothetical protein